MIIPGLQILVLAQLSACGLVGDQDHIRPPGHDTPEVEVVIAARDLPPGVPIAKEDVYTIEIAASWLPAGAFLTPDHVVGRIPVLPIHADEQILARAMADPESGLGVQAVVPRGMRAVPFESLGGLPTKAGMYLDLWWNPPNGPPCAVAQAVFVLAPNRRMDTPDGGNSLLLGNEQIPQVLTAMDHPSFRLVARSDLDVGHVEELKCSP